MFRESSKELLWRQSSWIAEDTIQGADLSEIPDQSGKDAAAQFYGLALSSYPSTYIDGTGSDHLLWFHSVGSNAAWGGGIPGDRLTQAAYSSSLYVLKQEHDICEDLDIDGLLNECSSELDSTQQDI